MVVERASVRAGSGERGGRTALDARRAALRAQVFGDGFGAGLDVQFLVNTP
jgi:hypothetical protein